MDYIVSSANDADENGVKIGLDNITFGGFIAPKADLNISLITGFGGVQAGESFPVSIMFDFDTDKEFEQFEFEDQLDPEQVSELYVASLKNIGNAYDLCEYLDHCYEEALADQAKLRIIYNDGKDQTDFTDDGYLVPQGQVGIYLETPFYRTKVYLSQDEITKYFDFD